MKYKDIQAMSDDELAKKLEEGRAELFNLRFQMATSQLDNTARVKIVKKDIARVLTEQRAPSDRRGEVRRPELAGDMTMAETEKRNARKVVTGTVVSISGDKSITVKIDYRKRHPKYGKMMTISKKLHAHDEKNECGVGDLVTVMETRPLSKTKRWRLVEIVERAK